MAVGIKEVGKMASNSEKEYSMKDMMKLRENGCMDS